MAGAPLRRVLLLGAGGAGAAVAHALLECGVGADLISRSRTTRGRPRLPAAGRALSARTGRRSRRTSQGRSKSGGRHRQRDAGRHGQAAGHADRRRLLRRECWVADVIYFPAGDRAARAARRRRLPHVGGERHGDLPGGAGLRAVHRHCAGRGSDEPAFRRLSRSDSRRPSINELRPSTDEFVTHQGRKMTFNATRRQFLVGTGLAAAAAAFPALPRTSRSCASRRCSRSRTSAPR